MSEDANHVDSARFVRIREKAAQFKFGTHSREDLEAARAIASAAIDRYGDFANDTTWAQYRENGIWNDHAAVQSALVAIRMMRDELAPPARWSRALEPNPEGEQ